MVYKLIDYEDLKAFSESQKVKYAKKSDLNSVENNLALSISDINTLLKQKIDNKVDKKEGYGLSKNDYDDTEKEKLNSSINKIVFKALPKRDIARLICTNNTGDTVDVDLPMARGYFSGLMSSADKGKLDSIDGGANKTTKLSQLENDTNFKTESEIQSMIEKASSLKKEVVTSLPTTGKDDVIYLVKDPKGKDNNNYLEYLWLNGKYELIGSTQVDLSGYATKEDINGINRNTENIQHLQDDMDNFIPKTDVLHARINGESSQLYTAGVVNSLYAELMINVQAATQGVANECENKLNKTDIQEFTQQELEEAFK